MLATLVEAYEAEHFLMDPPDPIEAIRFRMEQQGLTRKDLERLLGTRTRVSEVLNRKRSFIDSHDPAAARGTRHLGRGPNPPDPERPRCLRGDDGADRGRAGLRRWRWPHLSPSAQTKKSAS